MRPRLLDLFCCEGGAGAGYLEAGWTVTGVDRERRFARRYPGPFFTADALDYVAAHGAEYDAIHASPPCQGYSRGNAGRETSWPKLIGQVRDVLDSTGRPYVIENVKDAGWDMCDPVTLCGCMFDLSTVDTDGITIHLQRPRLFETNWGLTAPRPCWNGLFECLPPSYTDHIGTQLLAHLESEAAA